ncbi:MAG: carbohydrate ABC transporter permease [Bacillota bacterium]
MKKNASDVLFNALNVVFMLIMCFITIYPVWYVLVHSFNDGFDSAQGGIYWLPRKFTMENYKEVFRNNDIIKAFTVSVFRTIIATACHVFFTAMVAYAFLKRELMGRKIYMTAGIITMFFSGGLIPTFIVIRTLGLFDNFLVYVFPAMFSFFDLLVFQAFFRTIPEALEESAKMDGANAFMILIKIILPVSKAVLATILLFNGVFNWNDFFMGIIYINNTDLHPIQTYLYKMIITSESSKASLLAGGISQSKFTSTSLQMATMTVTTVPIICIYPFLQKHFVKGMLLGSIKE